MTFITPYQPEAGLVLLFCIFAAVALSCSERYSLSVLEQIEVGDLIVINNRESVPCDVLIVGVDEPVPTSPAGIAYVETKSLDGETNLKIRQVGIHENERQNKSSVE